MPSGGPSKPGGLAIERVTSATDYVIWRKHECYYREVLRYHCYWRGWSSSMLWENLSICTECRKISRYEDGWLFENVAKFRCLGITEIRIACMRELRADSILRILLPIVQNFFLSSRFMSNNISTILYKTVILPFVLYGCETWSVTIRAGHRLRVLENRVLRKILEPRREREQAKGYKLYY